MTVYRFIKKTLAILLVIVVLYVFITIFIGTQPFDDSDIYLKHPVIGNEDNGYATLVKGLGHEDDEPRSNVPPKNLREIPDSEWLRFNDEYADRYDIIQSALSFQAIIKTANDANCKVHFKRATDIARYALMLAWRDIDNRDVEGALKHIHNATQLGYSLQNMNGGFIPTITGSIIQEQSAMTINSMLNENLIPIDQLSAVSQIVNNYTPPIEAWEHAVKIEYSEIKALVDESIENQAKQVGALKKWSLDRRKNKILKQIFDAYTVMQGLESNFPVSTEPWDNFCLAWARKTTSWNFTLFYMIYGQDENSLNGCMDLFDVNKYLHIHMLHRTQWALLNTKAAILDYRSKNGELPGSLSSLVPDYLKTIPIDPFDGKEIRYDAESGVVYSIGYNLVNDDCKQAFNVLDESFVRKSNAEKLVDYQKDGDLILRIDPNYSPDSDTD